MARYTIRIPDGLNDDLEALVEEEALFNSKAEAIRYAIRNHLQYEVMQNE